MGEEEIGILSGEAVDTEVKRNDGDDSGRTGYWR